jgi:uncharacterized protein YndB with AHSA1/START domain
MALRFTIAIDAPPERVFSRLAEVTSHPSWSNPKAKMTMEQTVGSGPGPDARYRSTGLFAGKPVAADITVTAFDPPRRFAIRSDQQQRGKKDVWYLNDYTLEPRGGGTVLHKRVTSSTSPLILFLAYPAVRADAMTSLRSLKRSLESGP